MHYMKYRILPLCGEYMPEQKDYFHRHKELSKWLYEEWLKSNTNQSFTSWTQSTAKVPNEIDCVFYWDQESLERIKVHCIEDGLAAHETPATLIFGREASMKPLNSDKPLRGDKCKYALVIPATRDELYAAKMNVKGIPGDGYRVHHSSLAAGGDVRFAAEAILKNGKFTSITDESGHYKPDLYAFVYGLCFIQDSRFDLSSARIGVTRNTSSGRAGDRHSYDSAVNFLSLYRENGFDSSAYCDQEQYDVKDAYEHFRQKQNKKRAIYFVKGKNDLYEFILDSGYNISYVSFSQKYQELYCNPSSAMFRSTDEDFIKRPRLSRN